MRQNHCHVDLSLFKVVIEKIIPLAFPDNPDQYGNPGLQWNCLHIADNPGQ